MNGHYLYTTSEKKSQELDPLKKKKKNQDKELRTQGGEK